LGMKKPGIEPVVWKPPLPSESTPDPLPTLRTFPLPGSGPEDVLLAADGSVLTGVDDGRILRLDPETSHVTVVADTGGRPLGLEWLPDGRLLVCDAELGLLAVETNRNSEREPTAIPTTGLGKIETLVDQVDGQQVRICNNASVGADGTIWFTDSSARFDFAHWKGDLIEHRGTGRLLRRDPDGSTSTVCAGLQFANGVALNADESAIYVAETGAYALARIDLTGSSAGVREPVAENLPGFPDNVSLGDGGLVWVAIASPRNPIIDRLSPLPPLLRRAVWALPEKAQPKPAFEVGLVAMDPKDGSIVHNIAGQNPEFGVSTGVRERNGTVWLGSLSANSIASFELADL
jgi:sugar lactone lactonase YvrE